jgi:hypothetical protein
MKNKVKSTFGEVATVIGAKNYSGALSQNSTTSLANLSVEAAQDVASLVRNIENLIETLCGAEAIATPNPATAGPGVLMDVRSQLVTIRELCHTSTTRIELIRQVL